MGSILGVRKIAAVRIGLSLSEYEAQVAKGLKWCSAGSHWTSEANFHKDTSRGSGLKAHCQVCSYRPRSKENLDLKPESVKVQLAASSAVKYAVQKGELPKVTTLVCGCGKPAKHYHHYNGYEVEHQLDVKALCISCHKQAHRVKNGSNHNQEV